jgi:hypothetical protein
MIRTLVIGLALFGLPALASDAPLPGHDHVTQLPYKPVFWVDAGTGCQYIITRTGGITLRRTAHGLPMCPFSDRPPTTFR